MAREGCVKDTMALITRGAKKGGNQLGHTGG